MGELSSVEVRAGWDHLRTYRSRTIASMISHARILSALIAVTLVTGSHARLSAQGQPARRPAPKTSGQAPAARPPERTVDREVEPAAGNDAGTAKLRRPPAERLRIEPLAPELEQILIEWEQESAKIKTLVGEHERIVYNSVFEVEKVAAGKFFYDSPDKGRIDIKGLEPKEGAVSKKTNPKTGQPYRLEADQETRWICTGKEIMNINDAEKSFEMFPLPEELQGTNIIHGPLPFLFGMKADEAKRRFEVAYVAENDPRKNNEKVVWLTAKPRQDADKENFQLATIILDRKRYLPLAVKLLDPSGNLETVYTFKELHVNKREVIPPVFRNDPFHPTLRGYKMVQQEVIPQKGGKAETAGRSNIRQTSGTNPKTVSTETPPRPRTQAPSTRPPLPRSKN